jgi:Holliday junction DNA helicase RuvA
MIAFVRGRVVDCSDGSVVVDVQGVGHLVHVPVGTVVPAPGREVILHTSLQVREDSMTLYGFADRDALRLFEILLSSSGVGPKLALAALSALTPRALETAIAEGDAAVLTSVPGIGKKVAERIILDLRERIGAVRIAPLGSVAAADDDILTTVREALAGFGFTAVEVRDALARLDRIDGEDGGGLLRRALRELGGVREGAA